MSTALRLLGIDDEVQEIFNKDYLIDDKGNVVFHYLEGKNEVYGIGKHIIPKLSMPWISHRHPLESIRDVYLFESAIEALCFTQCNLKKGDKRNFEFALFLSFGRMTFPQATDWICENVSNKNFYFVFSNTLLGRVMDCRIAARLALKTVRIQHYDETVFVEYLHDQYRFNEDAFTLDAFKKETGFALRNARTIKPPKPYRTFKDLVGNQFGDRLKQLGS